MASGYVLEFTDRTFSEFFQRLEINIDDDKYKVNGSSKAKRLRMFWELESDKVVAAALIEMLDYGAYLNSNHPNRTAGEKRKQMASLRQCREIVKRLQGIPKQSESRIVDTDNVFLKRNWGELSFDKLDLDPSLEILMASRATEASKCAENGMPLASIILTGSILEGLLLHAASLKPQEFNRASCAPKGNGKPKPFHAWSLAQLIDAAHECGYLREDVKKFSHALREFRNYIHPHEQLLSKFAPDKHTAAICLQVLKLSIISLKHDKPIATGK